MTRPGFLPDNFTLSLIATVVVASFFPARGVWMGIFNGLTTIAIALLFFLHGAKLSREAIVAGATHWRLHLVVFTASFLVFPLLGLALKPVLAPLVTPELYLGVLFLCTLPSTVQSSIAFTAIARGNVPAAVCSASASSLIGIVLTPVLAGMIVLRHVSAGNGGASLAAIGDIVAQLLVPFVAGHVSRRWIGSWVDARKSMLKLVDQSSILLVVYVAFSEAVDEGLWRHTPLLALAGVLIIDAILLALALGMTRIASRRLGFRTEDEVTIVFCGSKKSLASGVATGKVLFAGHALGAIVLPVMLFHQIQLMTCAVLARRYAQRNRTTVATALSPVTSR